MGRTKAWGNVNERTRRNAAGTLFAWTSAKETTVSSGLNTLRAVLVAGTFVTAVMLATRGQITPAILLGVGIVAHFGLWEYLRRQNRQAAPVSEVSH